MAVLNNALNKESFRISADIRTLIINVWSTLVYVHASLDYVTN